MNGDLYGDFTRAIGDSGMHFNQVLLQQGQPILDADWNQAFAIVHEHMAALARDIIGPHGGPAGQTGFEIIATEKQFNRHPNLRNTLKGALQGGFLIGPGSYYVDGVLCRNEHFITYAQQRFKSADTTLPPGRALVYVDCWERIFHDVEDARPGIREVALRGDSPARRSQVAWQVKLLSLDIPDATPKMIALSTQFDKVLGAEQTLRALNGGEQPKEDKRREARLHLLVERRHMDYLISEVLHERSPAISRVRLRVRAHKQGGGEPCITPPGANYLGDNILGRVELCCNELTDDPTQVTFLWDSKNGSDVYPIADMITSKEAGTNDAKLLMTLEHLGHDTAGTLKRGDLVEFVGVDEPPRQAARALFKIETPNIQTRRVTLTPISGTLINSNTQRALLRRWRKAPVKVADAMPSAENPDPWVDLENGIQVQFVPDRNEQGVEIALVFQSYDYWLVPARTATGDVEWPRHKDEKTGAPVWEALPPHGVVHHYAPLAIIQNGAAHASVDCRYVFEPRAAPLL
jgi:Family of unknown function (DUF6519)